jgi:dipeptidyl-peptidase-3
MFSLYQQVDRQRLLSHGAQVMGKLLLELQVRKSTADGEGAREYYEKLTNPLPGWEGELRDLVIAKKQVRFSCRSPLPHCVDRTGDAEWRMNDTTWHAD